MFGLFKSRKFSDVDLGELSWERGFWRCVIVLDPCGEIPLAVAGNKNGPDASALAEAYQLHSRFPEWQKNIEQALFEHYEPYSDAMKAGEYSGASEFLLNIKSPEDALSRSKLRFIAIGPIGGTMMTELGYDTEWDEEHMLGVRFKAEKFFELCGSTVPA